GRRHHGALESATHRAQASDKTSCDTPGETSRKNCAFAAFIALTAMMRRRMIAKVEWARSSGRRIGNQVHISKRASFTKPRGMPMTNHVSCRLAGLAIAAGLAFGVAGSAALAQTKVIVRTDFKFNGYHTPVALGIERGYYKEAGLDV